MKLTGRYIITVTGVLCIGLLFLLVVARVFGEPRFEGRKLSEWLGGSDLTETEMQRAVREIGTNGIPYFQKWLLDDPGWLELQIRNVNTRQNWFNFDYAPSIDANIRAMRGFLYLEELAAPSIPWLIQGVERQDLDFSFYARALLAIGAPGRDALMKVYPKLNTNEKKQVARVSYLHVVRDPQLASFFVQFINDDDLTVSTESMLLIRNLKARCPQVLYDAVAEKVETGTSTQRETARIVTKVLLDKQPDVIGK